MTRAGIASLTLNFSDGMNTTDNPRLIPATKATQAQNIDFSIPGQFSKWNGYATMKATAPSGSMGSTTVLGVYDYMTPEGIHYAVAGAGDGKIYKMDSLDGTWDAISGASGLSTGDVRYDFSVLSGKLYIVNGADAPRTWDGTTYGTLGGSPPALASMVESCYGYLWMNDETDANSSYIYRSAFYNGASWGTAINYYPIDTSDGTRVRGIKAGKKILYVWKDRSLHSINMVDSNATTPTFRRYRLFEIGTCSHKSIVKTEYGIVWFDGEKVWLWDEQNYPKEISMDIKDDILSFAKSRNSKVAAVWLPTKNQYWMAVSYGTVSVNNRVYVCSFENGKYKWAYYEISANDIAIFDSSGSQLLHFAESGTTGFVYKANSGDSFTGADFTGCLKSKWFSPQDFGLESERAYLDEIQVTVSTDGDWEVKIGYERDFEPTSQTYPVNQFNGGYTIGGTYIIGQSLFGGAKENKTDTKRFKGISFKTIRLTFTNRTASQPFTIKEVKISVKAHKRI